MIIYLKFNEIISRMLSFLNIILTYLIKIKLNLYIPHRTYIKTILEHTNRYTNENEHNKPIYSQRYIHFEGL